MYRRDKCLHELFELQAEARAGEVAAVFGPHSLTYRELNERANQLAHYLRRLGVGPDVPVGICVSRSVEMVVGLLGILKAGGAYVPLDPTYPAQRLEFMLADTQATVLLTQQSLVTHLPVDQAKVERLCLDTDWELVTRESRRNPANPCAAESLAYVMYTSGSTGQPKGVAVPHRAVSRLVLNTNFICLTSTDRIAQVSKISFDAATFEIWGALLNGARLAGITREVALSPRDFVAELRDQGITAMFLTSALFNQVAGEVPGAFETLSTVIAGGEALDPKWVRTVLRHRPPQRLVNGYGPTENTTFTCCGLIQEVPDHAINVPIGRPIANTQVYILDPYLNPVPIGVPGELYTGGDGLARGYWQRPELTAKKFVSNPFVSDASARIYRTGDLARWRPDGQIEFLGRIDQQVKIRGFRIELGEIETVLGRHPGVSECVVTARGDSTAEKRLVACFVPNGNGRFAPNASELRGFLEARLPDYMVPAAFIPLTALPLTPNGKVDRDALPAPDQARPDLDKKYTSPRDPVETRLTEIWEKVLGVHPIGVQDKFFELGGHSLLAVRLIALVEKAFGRKLRLATIFKAPTIEQLAAILREEIKEGSVAEGSSVVEIQSKGSRPPLFLVHGAGGGMFWGYVNLSRHLGADQPVYGFKAPDLEDAKARPRLEEMAARYIADLRAIQPRGPYCLGGYCFGGNVAYEMARQLEEQGESVALLALLNCAPPNSGYARITWTPLWWGRFARNLWYWAKYVREWTPTQRREFFRWKWCSLKRKLARLPGARQAPLSPENAIAVGDLVDLSSFTPEQRRVWESHIHALVNFQPKPYSGRVHLFRSSGHPLWCSFDPNYGWGEFCRGELRATIVPGTHEKILQEPCVGVVAAQLRRALENGTGSGETASEPAREAPALPVISRRAAPDDTPLSWVQQRLWLLNQLEPANPAYIQVVGLRLRGALDVAALERSLHELKRRHEVLRTVFPSNQGLPSQRVLEPELSPLRLLDLAGTPSAERETRLIEIASEEKRRPFDLARETPMRAILLRFEPGEHVLLVTLHELVTDPSAREILPRELSALYEVQRSGRAAAFPEPPLQYADFAAWQRAQLSTWNEDLTFWKHQLTGVPTLLELPADHPRPAVQTYRAGTETRELSPELARTLSALGRRHGAEFPLLCLSAAAVLLNRYTRHEDFLIGKFISYRVFPELQNLPGNFSNLTPLRVDVSGDPTFREFLDRLRDVETVTARRQNVPFPKLIEELHPARDLSYHPVVQVFFWHWSESQTVVDAGGLQFRAASVEETTTKFDLSFQLVETSHGARLRIQYALDLFEEETVRRMLGHWQTLLESIVADPDRRLSGLSMLPAAEERLVLETWNATEAAYPKEGTLAGLFEAQVVRTPDAEALVCGDTRLTYRQLHERARQVSSQLRARGIGQGDLVGICLERSWQMLAGILGTLQAGAAYVPMDPAYPQDRLMFMLEDAKVRLLLTQRQCRDRVVGSEAGTLCLDELSWENSACETESPAAEGPRATDVAYVIYTSGSTGRPKGVAIEHRSAVALVCWAGSVFSADELAGVLAATSICFDLSIFEMFVPLCWGGKVILAENALALPKHPAAREVTLLNTVPSAIRELLRMKGVSDSVRVVNLAGEPLPASLVDQIYRETRAQKVYDLYGPSETTTYSTGALRRPGMPATIGRPLANEQVYLLDSHLLPVPIGVPGELYIGGDGLARGYLNRPELTAERFIAHPFRSGARLYRTGDLARWRADGTLEFLGRIDHQVKIRGFRIELGEVEAALKKHPAVRETVVVAREDAPGDKRLVAYLALHPEKSATPEDLRQGLKQWLPEYMAPSVFVFLEALPMTPNGKVDRKALPAPEGDRHGSSRAFVPPRTPAEIQLAEIWREVLQLQEVGARDNFFDLGGHSLLAIQTIARVRDAFKVELPLSALFDAPTITALAEALCTGRWAATREDLVLLQPISRAGLLPVSFVQERLWFLEQLDAGDAYHVPLALRLRGRLDVAALQRALDAVIDRHEALRTTFQHADGGLCQVVAPSLSVPIRLENVRSQGCPGAELGPEVRALMDSGSAAALRPGGWSLGSGLAGKARSDGSCPGPCTAPCRGRRLVTRCAV